MSLKIDYCIHKEQLNAYNAVREAITPELLGKFQVKADLDYKTDFIIE